MKNLKIKTFHIPSFMIDAIELELEVSSIKEKIEQAKLKLQAIKSKKREYLLICDAAMQFRSLILKCYPQESQTPVIKTQLEILTEFDFDSLKELGEFIATVLFAIYFSKGDDKVIDLNTKLFDDEKCQKLFDQEIYIPESWLKQFIRCLNEKNANEDMLLHNFTPEWMWSKCFRMMLELYELTKEFQLNKHK
jgi:hypothetical protein